MYNKLGGFSFGWTAQEPPQSHPRTTQDHLGPKTLIVHEKMSKGLRVAQERILELETLVERLRGENEELLAAAETLKSRTDQLMSENEKLESRLVDEREVVEAEKKLAKEAMSEKNRELFELRQKLEGLEARMAANMQKVRVRERELENRLELVKMERWGSGFHCFL